MDELFEGINTDSYYYIRKSVRKILSQIKKFIRYSKKKETEVENSRLDSGEDQSFPTKITYGGMLLEAIISPTPVQTQQQL